MPALAEVQRTFASALLSGDFGPIAALIAGGEIQPEARIAIHRNTMLGTLAGALKLSYPAVEALVGPEFFEQAARAFALRHPPRRALLSLYGADFPGFLADYAPASSLPYLADVARLEWAVEQAAQGPAQGQAPPAATIDLPGVTLNFVPSLALLDTGFPAEPIWRAVLENDDAALGRIDPGPAPCSLAVWREGDGAAVAPLGPVAAVFLKHVLAGGDAESALQTAAEADPAGDPIAFISAEIFQAGFVRLIHSDPIS